MKVHKLAKYFPVLEGEEFDLLVQDIKENGQREPIVMIGDEVLDGVNRWMACEQLGIEPMTKEYDNGDPLNYVISMNIRRRHLNISQRAQLATEMLPEFEIEARKRQATALKGGGRITSKEVNRPKGGQQASDDAGKYFGVSGASVERAKRIKEQAPEKVEDIIKGVKTVSEVDTELREAKANELAKEREERQDEKTAKEHPKYVKEYLEGMRTFISSIKKTIACVKTTSLAPETLRFIINKHEQIIELFNKLEGE